MKNLLAAIWLALGTEGLADIAYPPTPPLEALSAGMSVSFQSPVAAYRQNAGLSGLHVDDALTCVAVIQAAYLARMGNLCVHNASTGDLSVRAKACGAERVSGEVIGCGYDKIETVITAWDASPLHKKILMNPLAKRMGATIINRQVVLVLGY